MTRRVLVTEEIAERGLDLLRSAGFTVDVQLGLDPQGLRSALVGAHALIIRSATQVDAEALAAGTDLMAVGRAGIGLDNVDVAEATRRGVMVINAPTSNILSTAEHTMAMLLASARNVPQAHRDLTAGRWNRSQWEGVELHGKTLGVVGLGKIGALVAQRALAFGMHLVVYDPYISEDRARHMGVELMTLDELLSRSDFITIHLPKNKETTNLLDAAALRKCKPGVRIINVARGGIVNEADLAEAVKSGHVQGAALDVFEKEPTTESPLFELPSVVVAPHLGASTVEAQDKAGDTIAEMVVLALRHREGRVLLLSLFLMVVGYSTHLYLPIRAAQHPAVNEGAPATWDKMRDLLERKQYGEMHLLPRRGDFVKTQLDKEFWRYFKRQWPLWPDERLWTAILPILLGLLGGVWQMRRDFKGFALTFVFLGLSTAGMIVFLNFSDHEVRDRDYFFQSGFHAYAIWIGLGVAWLVQWVRESFAEASSQRMATIATCGLLALQPALMLRTLWHTHDRSGNYIARDYAYNMLATLAPNSFIFTNGDNDTFPLWYIQQVEDFRKDVRIVNLSLLNTDWYIRQLRDEEPRIPIALDDRTIDQLGAGAFQDEKGNIIYTNEFMVHHIMDQCQTPTGWKKQPYFAVTVPQDFGYGSRFLQKGIVQQVMFDSTKAGLDLEATHKALYETYKYRGLLTADGSWDPKVYKDDNAQNLSKNYAFAHMQLAQAYRRANDFPHAIAEMERVSRMFPDWIEIQLPLGGIYLAAGDSAKAWAFYDGLVQRVPGSAEAHYYRGASLGYRGKPSEAVAEFETAIRLDPDYGYAYYDLFGTLWETGRREEAVQALEKWVERHPDDRQSQMRLSEARAQLGQGGSNPLGAPTMERPR